MQTPLEELLAGRTPRADVLNAHWGHVSWSEERIEVEMYFGRGFVLDERAPGAAQLAVTRKQPPMDARGGKQRRELAKPHVLLELRGPGGARLRLSAEADAEQLEGLSERPEMGAPVDFEMLLDLLGCARLLGTKLVHGGAGLDEVAEVARAEASPLKRVDIGSLPEIPLELGRREIRGVLTERSDRTLGSYMLEVQGQNWVSGKRNAIEVQLEGSDEVVWVMTTEQTVMEPHTEVAGRWSTVSSKPGAGSFQEKAPPPDVKVRYHYFEPSAGTSVRLLVEERDAKLEALIVTAGPEKHFEAARKEHYPRHRVRRRFPLFYSSFGYIGLAMLLLSLFEVGFSLGHVMSQTVRDVEAFEAAAGAFRAFDMRALGMAFVLVAVAGFASSRPRLLKGLLREDADAGARAGAAVVAALFAALLAQVVFHADVLPVTALVSLETVVFAVAFMGFTRPKKQLRVLRRTLDAEPLTQATPTGVWCRGDGVLERAEEGALLVFDADGVGCEVEGWDAGEALLCADVEHVVGTGQQAVKPIFAPGRPVRVVGRLAARSGGTARFQVAGEDSLMVVAHGGSDASAWIRREITWRIGLRVLMWLIVLAMVGNLMRVVSFGLTFLKD